MKEGLHPKPGQEPPLGINTPPPNHIAAIINNSEMDPREINRIVEEAY